MIVSVLNIFFLWALREVQLNLFISNRHSLLRFTANTTVCHLF